MSTLRVVGRNIVSNWVGLVVHAVMLLLLTPFVVNQLGAERYGIWMLVVGLTGSYGLLDLGLRGGFMRFFTHYLALRDYDNMNKTASSGFFALAAVGAVIMAVTLAMAWGAPAWFDKIPPELDGEVFWCILIVGASIAVQMPLTAHSSVLMAAQRFDVANAIAVATRLITAGAIYLSLSQGLGLITLSAITALGVFGDFGLRGIYAYRIVPQLHVSWRLADWANLKEMAVFGAWQMLFSVNLIVLSYTNPIIITALVALAAVTPYVLASQIAQYLAQVVGPIGNAFFPAATDLHARGEHAALRRQFLLGSRALLLITFCAGVITMAWADRFFDIWVGSKYAASDDYPAVADLFYVLMSAMVVSQLGGVGGWFLLGAGKVKFLALTALAEAVANLAISVSLAPSMGLMGVALGTLIPAIVFRGVIIVHGVCRFFGVSIWHYFVDVVLRPLIVAAALVGAALLIRQIGPAASWPQLIMQGAIALACGAALSIGVGLKAHERGRLIYEPLGKIWGSRRALERRDV